MWCAQCMQDVPVLPDGSNVRCSRCQAVLSAPEHLPQASQSLEAGTSAGLPASSAERLRHELEALEVDLLQTRCQLEAIQTALQQEPEDWQWLWASEGYLRWDAQSVALRGPQGRQATPAKPPLEQASPAVQSTPAQTAARHLGELLIYLAAMFFSLGGVLAAWAHWGAREQFWGIAWPALAGSAAGLLLGVLLRAWAGPPPKSSAERQTSALQQAPSQQLGSHRADPPERRSSGPHWSAAVEAVSGVRWEGGAAEVAFPAGTSG